MLGGLGLPEISIVFTIIVLLYLGPKMKIWGGKLKKRFFEP